MASKNKRITIADVAKKAGLSRTTVSLVLNGTGQISQKTRDHVTAVAKQLNYHPSIRAQRLRTGRSYSIALLSSMPPSVSAGIAQLGFFTEVAIAVAQTALSHKYVLQLAPPMEEQSELLQRLDIDGALVLEPCSNDPLIQALADADLPFVTIGGNLGPMNIELYHNKSAELILEHLAAVGSQDVGLIVGSSGRNSQNAFLKTYLAIAKQYGWEPAVIEVNESEEEEAGYQATKELLAKHKNLDALCVPIDAFASGAVRAITDAGRVLGQDIRLATRYDGMRARVIEPQLTAVNLHLADVASAAVHRLLNHLQGKNIFPDQQPEPPKLIVRPSTQIIA